MCCNGHYVHAAVNKQKKIILAGAVKDTSSVGTITINKHKAVGPAATHDCHLSVTVCYVEKKKKKL
jgi:hypothetical protein